MKRVIFPIIFLILLCNIGSANELLIISGKNSKNSNKWKVEVSDEYANSETGKIIPIKLVLIERDQFPKWITEAMEEGRLGEIVGTPTFIIWDEQGKKELGRLEGYTDKSKFYKQLNGALLQISEGLHPGRREGSGGHEMGSPDSRRQMEGSGGMSQDIMDHVYKTSEEAKRASKMLGLGGEIHSHNTPQGIIYMPGTTM